MMGERVIWNRIPIATDPPNGRLWPWWIDELARKEPTWLTSQSGAMGWRPDVVVPGDDFTRGTDGRRARARAWLAPWVPRRTRQRGPIGHEPDVRPLARG